MRHAVIAGLFAAGAATACGSATEAHSVVDTLPSVICELTVSPASSTLKVGDILTLKASLCGTQAVIWSSSAPAVASVDSAGQVRAVGAGAASIIAKSKADPTIQGAAVVAVTDAQAPGSSVVVFQTMNEVGPPSTPANLLAIRDSIDVAAQVTSSDHISEVRLVANNGVRDTTVASNTTALPAGGGVVHLFWNTNAKSASGARVFPNGAYTLRLAAVGGVATYSSSPLQVTISNP